MARAMRSVCRRRPNDPDAPVPGGVAEATIVSYTRHRPCKHRLTVMRETESRFRKRTRPRCWREFWTCPAAARVRALCSLLHLLEEPEGGRQHCARVDDSGIAVLRFDFTGLGQSEGEFADTNFSSNVADLIAAVRLHEHVSTRAPSILVGHSLGGTAVCKARRSVGSAVAVATIGSPSGARARRAYVFRIRRSSCAQGEAIVASAAARFS